MHISRSVSVRLSIQSTNLSLPPLSAHASQREAVAPSTCYELRRATHCPEHPRSGNCQTPLPCPSESCPSALAHTPSAPMLTSTRPRSPTRPSAVKKPRSPAWLISPFRMNSSISRSTQDPWLTLSDTDQVRHTACEPVPARRPQAKRTAQVRSTSKPISERIESCSLCSNGRDCRPPGRACSTPSTHPSAPTTSPPPHMTPRDRIPL